METNAFRRDMAGFQPDEALALCNVGVNKGAKPAVFADGPLYVVFPTTPPPGGEVTYAFLEGQDRADGGVDFSTVMTPPPPAPPPNDVPVTLTLNTVVQDLGFRLPGVFQAVIDIELAVDPNDPDRLFVTYVDLETPLQTSAPIDVWTVVLARSGSNWTASDPIQVSCPPCQDCVQCFPVGFDRFMPTMTVDDRSMIHVLFYTDRQYPTQIDNEPTPKFDVSYSCWDGLSTPPGSIAFHGFTLDNATPLHFPNLGSAYQPGEYMGMDNYAGEIWTAYVSTFTFSGLLCSSVGCDDLNPCSLMSCIDEECTFASETSNACRKSQSMIRSRNANWTERRFVKPSGDDMFKDGKSWNNAYATLRKALEVAADPVNGITEIRVTEGTYAPGEPGDRTATFALVSGVKIFGGYRFNSPDPNSLVHDPEAFPSILSGLAVHCVISEDCPVSGDDCTNGVCGQSQVFDDAPYHIVTADGVGATTTLDGFVIEYGNANGTASRADGLGGGLYLVNNSKPVIRNCTVRNNYALWAGGGMNILGGGNPSISKCTFDGNDSQEGGAIMIEQGCEAAILDSRFAMNSATTSTSGCGGGAIMIKQASARIARCAFEQNSSGCNGGAIASTEGSTLRLLGSSFLGNTAPEAGGISASGIGSLSVVANCWFHGNAATSWHGGAIVLGGKWATVTNCTFTENTSIVGAAGIHGGTTLYEISNCIFWGNSSSGFTWLSAQLFGFFGPLSGVVSYSCIQDDTPGATPFPFPEGTGNIDLDPMFEDQVGGNLHLQRFSPCIDAGNNDVDIDVAVAGVQPLGDRDADGAPRFVDDRTVTGVGTEPIVDMGVFESPLVPIFVDASATCEAACDGRTWATAYTALQDALGDAQPGDEVWVAAGTYHPTDQTCDVDGDCGGGAPNFCAGGSCSWDQPRAQTFQLQDGVSLLGGFNGSELTREARNFGVNDSILSGDLNGDDAPVAVSCIQDSPDCDDFGGVCIVGSCFIGSVNNDENSYHVVSANNVNASAVLDGFVVQAGNANGPSNTFGGGMRIFDADPTIRHCRFLGNSASSKGGAVWTSSIGFASGTFINCLFSGNIVFDEDALGGALYIETATPFFLELLNCTFASNKALAGMGGGVHQEFGISQLTNCVLWGNHASFSQNQAAQMSFGVFSAQPTLTYSVIHGVAGEPLWPGTENVAVTTLDMVFMDALGPDGIAGTLDDDLRVMATSAALDIGLNAVILPLADVDLSGSPRLFNTIVDAGAYEFEFIPTGLPNLDEDPSFVPKNRYISFQPGQVEAAIAVTLTDSNLFPDLIGETWWVDQEVPLHADLYSLGCDMVFIDWSLLEDDVISVADE